MCLILFDHRPGSARPLVVAANRDEFFERPSAAARPWQDDPRIVGGRDLLSGGSWLGVRDDGRFAAVTNYREMVPRDPQARSRGELVADFLGGERPPALYLDEVRGRAETYRGFSLLVGTPDELWCYSNRGPQPTRVSPGIHGLSNGLIDTGWPKVVRGRRALGEFLDRTDARAGDAALHEGLFELLADRTPAVEAELPDTGIGAERERQLSPAFIRAEGYGTRCSTVLVVDAEGNVGFRERSYTADGEAAQTVVHEWRLTGTEKARES